MEITQSGSGEDRIVVSVAGMVDVDGCTELRSVLSTLFARHRDVVVDASRLSYLDDMLTSALFAERRAARRYGVAMSVRVSASAKMKRFLDVTGLSELGWIASAEGLESQFGPMAAREPGFSAARVGKPTPADGAEAFERAIDQAPTSTQESSRRLLAWARALEARQLTSLKSVQREFGQTLLMWLPGERAGFVSISTHPEVSVSLSRSVFLRYAAEELAPIEELTEFPIGRASTISDPSDALLALLTTAYERAARTRGDALPVPVMAGSVTGPPEFSVAEEALDRDRYVIAVSGELDINNVAEFAWRLSDALESGKTRILIDLTETTHLDEEGFTEITRLQRKLRQRGGVLAIVNVDPYIAKTFETTGFDMIVAVRKTRADGIAALDDAAPAWRAKHHSPDRE